MFLSTYLPVILTLAFPGAVRLTAPYWFLIGCSLNGVFSALILKRVFACYLPKEEEEE